MNLPDKFDGHELAFAEAEVFSGGASNGSRALSNVEVESVAGGLNALMIPSGVVAAVMAALDMDEYWIPYFNQKMDDAGK